MSHSVKVMLIADQEIKILGDVVNIHDLYTIELGSHGEIISYSKHTEHSVAPDSEGRCTCGCMAGFSTPCPIHNNK